MSAAQSALEARSLDVIQCEDKSGQFICYRSGQIYLLTTRLMVYTWPARAWQTHRAAPENRYRDVLCDDIGLKQVAQASTHAGAHAHKTPSSGVWQDRTT